MKTRDHRTGKAVREEIGAARFEATVTKVQPRPCWSFAVEVEADEFKTLEAGQSLVARLGWFLVSSTRIGGTGIRFRGFGRPKLRVGERIEVTAEPVARERRAR